MLESGLESQLGEPYDLNERERLQGYPIWGFQWGDHTDTLHPSIQLNYRSTHTVGASSCACPMSFWYVWVWMCPPIICCSCSLNPAHKNWPRLYVSMCSLPANIKSQPPLKRQHVGLLRKIDPLHIHCSCVVWSIVFPLFYCMYDLNCRPKDLVILRTAAEHVHLCDCVHQDRFCPR